MKLAPVIPLVLALFLTGCGGPWVMERSELQRWYRDDLAGYSGAGKLGYKGSDADFHYFIARPVDNFVTIQVPKNQIKLVEEYPTSELGRGELYLYLVDPERGFGRAPHVSAR